MHVAFGARDLSLWNFENPRLKRSIQVAIRAHLNFRVAALLDEGRQPPDFEIAPDQDEDVGSLQFENKARLGFDEVRILVPLGDRIDRDVIAADLVRDRREILGGGHYIELAFCSEG